MVAFFIFPIFRPLGDSLMRMRGAMLWTCARTLGYKRERMQCRHWICSEGNTSTMTSSSEAVRKLVLEIKAETEENKICADCCSVGKCIDSASAANKQSCNVQHYDYIHRDSRLYGGVGVSVSRCVCVHRLCWHPQTAQRWNAHCSLHPPRHLEHDTLTGQTEMSFVESFTLLWWY